MFKPRFAKPEADNKYYIRKASGGYSDAILGNPLDPACDVLANCVGYAYGRFNEIGAYGECKYLAPVNAGAFMEYKGDLESGMTPKYGACAVWKKKGTASAGHVAIVEEIFNDTKIRTSESSYGGSVFYTRIRELGSDELWSQDSSYEFLGFIYNPAISDAEYWERRFKTVSADLKDYQVMFESFYKGYMKMQDDLMQIQSLTAEALK